MKTRGGRKKPLKQGKGNSKKSKKKKNTKTSPTSSSGTAKAGKPTKKTKRDKVKYPGLVKAVNSRFRREYMDQDYIDKLTDKEKQWLSNFNEEYLSGNFNHPGKKFHKTKKEKRECYSRNNARNRDVTNHAKAKGHLMQSNDYILESFEKSHVTDVEIQEDVLIKAIDANDEKKDE